VSFKHREILEKAIEALGLQAVWSGESVSIRVGRGLQIDLNAQQATTRCDASASTLNKLKRAYSKGVLKKAAKKNQWQMQVSAGNANKGFFRKG
jgi:hypothetical protein